MESQQESSVRVSSTVSRERQLHLQIGNLKLETSYSQPPSLEQLTRRVIDNMQQFLSEFQRSSLSEMQPLMSKLGRIDETVCTLLEQLRLLKRQKEPQIRLSSCPKHVSCHLRYTSSRDGFKPNCKLCSRCLEQKCYDNMELRCLRHLEVLRFRVSFSENQMKMQQEHFKDYLACQKCVSEEFRSVTVRQIDQMHHKTMRYLVTDPEFYRKNYLEKSSEQCHLQCALCIKQIHGKNLNLDKPHQIERYSQLFRGANVWSTHNRQKADEIRTLLSSFKAMLDCQKRKLWFLETFQTLLQINSEKDYRRFVERLMDKARKEDALSYIWFQKKQFSMKAIDEVEDFIQFYTNRLFQTKTKIGDYLSENVSLLYDALFANQQTVNDYLNKHKYSKISLCDLTENPLKSQKLNSFMNINQKHYQKIESLSVTKERQDYLDGFVQRNPKDRRKDGILCQTRLASQRIKFWNKWRQKAEADQVQMHMFEGIRINFLEKSDLWAVFYGKAKVERYRKLYHQIAMKETSQIEKGQRSISTLNRNRGHIFTPERCPTEYQEIQKSPSSEIRDFTASIEAEVQDKCFNLSQEQSELLGSREGHERFFNSLSGQYRKQIKQEHQLIKNKMVKVLCSIHMNRQRFCNLKNLQLRYQTLFGKPCYEIEASKFFNIIFEMPNLELVKVQGIHVSKFSSFLNVFREKNSEIFRRISQIQLGFHAKLEINEVRVVEDLQYFLSFWPSVSQFTLKLYMRGYFRYYRPLEQLINSFRERPFGLQLIRAQRQTGVFELLNLILQNKDIVQNLKYLALEDVSVGDSQMRTNLQLSRVLQEIVDLQHIQTIAFEGYSIGIEDIDFKSLTQIYNVPVRHYLLDLHRVKSLALAEGYRLGRSDWRQLVSLRSLSMNKPQIPEEVLEEDSMSFLTVLARLKQFRLTNKYFQEYNHRYLRKIMARLSQVTVFEIKEVNIDGQDFEVVPSKQLTRLVVQNCGLIDDKTVEFVGKKWPGLQELSLVGCRKVAGRGFTRHNFQSLRTLHIDRGQLLFEPLQSLMDRGVVIQHFPA